MRHRQQISFESMKNKYYCLKFQKCKILSFTHFWIRKSFKTNWNSCVAFRWIFHGNFASEITEAWKSKVWMEYEFHKRTTSTFLSFQVLFQLVCEINAKSAKCHMTHKFSEISSHMFFIHNILLCYSNSYQSRNVQFFSSWISHRNETRTIAGLVNWSSSLNLSFFGSLDNILHRSSSLGDISFSSKLEGKKRIKNSPWRRSGERVHKNKKHFHFCRWD